MLKGLKKYLAIEDRNFKKEQKENRNNQLKLEEYRTMY
mgnify:CR=1 FL=1